MIYSSLFGPVFPKARKTSSLETSARPGGQGGSENKHLHAEKNKSVDRCMTFFLHMYFLYLFCLWPESKNVVEYLGSRKTYLTLPCPALPCPPNLIESWLERSNDTCCYDMKTWHLTLVIQRQRIFLFRPTKNIRHWQHCQIFGQETKKNKQIDKLKLLYRVFLLSCVHLFCLYILCPWEQRKNLIAILKRRLWSLWKNVILFWQK
jgi:hypothetical protein